jgi:hypothetical protein
MPAPVVVGADARLLHSRYQGRACGRADRSGDRRVGKTHSVFAEIVKNWSFHQRFAIETIVLRLILEHDPQDIGQWSGDK